MYANDAVSDAPLAGGRRGILRSEYEPEEGLPVMVILGSEVKEGTLFKSSGRYIVDVPTAGISRDQIGGYLGGQGLGLGGASSRISSGRSRQNPQYTTATHPPEAETRARVIVGQRSLGEPRVSTSSLPIPRSWANSSDGTDWIAEELPDTPNGLRTGGVNQGTARPSTTGVVGDLKKDTAQPKGCGIAVGTVEVWNHATDEAAVVISDKCRMILPGAVHRGRAIDGARVVVVGTIADGERAAMGFPMCWELLVGFETTVLGELQMTVGLRKYLEGGERSQQPTRCMGPCEKGEMCDQIHYSEKAMPGTYSRVCGEMVSLKDLEHTGASGAADSAPGVWCEDHLEGRCGKGIWCKNFHAKIGVSVPPGPRDALVIPVAGTRYSLSELAETVGLNGYLRGGEMPQICDDPHGCSKGSRCLMLHLKGSRPHNPLPSKPLPTPALEPSQPVAAPSISPDLTFLVEGVAVPLSSLEKTRAIEYLTENPSRSARWCGYQATGTCRQGENCSFAHRADASSLKVAGSTLSRK
jgi:hypothetical protein